MHNILGNFTITLIQIIETSINITSWFLSDDDEIELTKQTTNTLSYVIHILQGRVVQNLVKVNPGLNVSCSINFSRLEMFFTSNVWYSLRLLQLKTAGQTI